tara:strand:- start:1452 stop:1691 length:240 start_codon:yes stop_codon:yes gene_type:complete
MEHIIYKSKYAEICDIIGRPKPKNQDEEDYCQLCEFEHPEMSSKVLSEIMGKENSVTEKMLGRTFKTFLAKLRTGSADR